MTIERGVSRIYQAGASYWVGDGFPVRNLFPSTGISREVDPFLMLDYAGPREFPPSRRPAGVGVHPHRGFETVTIAYQGSIAHRDSAGHSGVIQPGDVQWMTAGSGVLHEEKHDPDFAARGGVLEMVQLWVNLPAANKMSPPRYQALLDRDIPRVQEGGSYARVIAGELHGVKGHAQTFTRIGLFDVSLAAGSSMVFESAEGDSAAIFLRNGAIRVDGRIVEGEAQLALLETEGAFARVEASELSQFLVLTGRPIGEPVASQGPFVMNTPEELRQAIRDFQAGKMGSPESFR